MSAQDSNSRSRRGSILTQYLQEVGLTPLLTPEQEKSLATKIQRNMDEPSRQQMMKANLRLVVSIAKNYVPGSDPELLLDLIQEGNIGLMKAVDRFKPEHNTRFSTYAVYWIRQAIFRALKSRRVVRLPENVVDRVLRVRRRRQELYQLLGRSPTSKELAQDLGVTMKAFSLLEEASRDIVSLDQTVRGKNSSEETKLQELIEDVDSPSPDQILRDMMMKSNINQAVSTLPSREKKIVELRFGLQDNIPHTLEDIGKKFGISRERVRQLQKSALERLRARRQVARLR